MFTSVDKALAAALGALLPLALQQIGAAPEFLTQFGDTIQVVLAMVLAWAVPNKKS